MTHSMRKMLKGTASRAGDALLKVFQELEKKGKGGDLQTVLNEAKTVQRLASSIIDTLEPMMLRKMEKRAAREK